MNCISSSFKNLESITDNWTLIDQDDIQVSDEVLTVAFHAIGGSVLSIALIVKEIALTLFSLIVGVATCNAATLSSVPEEHLNELVRNVIRAIPVVGITLTHGFDRVENYITMRCVQGTPAVDKPDAL